MRRYNDGAHHWQMTRRTLLAKQLVVAGRMLWMALWMIAWHEATAESLPKPTGTNTNQVPSEVVLIQPIEFSAAPAKGQTNAAQAQQNETLKTDSGKVETALRNLAARLPAVTNLAARMEAQRQTTSGDLPNGKTFVEASMSPEIFKASGLDKLSRNEIEVLDRWLLTMSSELIAAGRAATPSSQDKGTMTAPGKKNDAALERVLLVKDFNGDRVLIQRSNGERWMLRAKTWCRWSWRYEGRYVSLLFGPISSQLINEEGESLNFWIDRKID